MASPLRRPGLASRPLATYTLFATGLCAAFAAGCFGAPDETSFARSASSTESHRDLKPVATFKETDYVKRA
jgi:hypothetical protein